MLSPRPPFFRIFFQVPYPLTPVFSHSSENYRGVGYSSQIGTALSANLGRTLCLCVFSFPTARHLLTRRFEGHSHPLATHPELF